MPTAAREPVDAEGQPSGLDAESQSFETPESLMIQGLHEFVGRHAEGDETEDDDTVALGSGPDAEASGATDSEGDQSETLLPPSEEDEAEDATNEVEESDESTDEGSEEEQEDEEQAAAVQRWAEELVRKPQRISEVRVAFHGQVLEAALRHQAELVANQIVTRAEQSVTSIRQSEVPAAYQQGYQKGLTDASNAFVQKAEMDELDALAESNPEAFAALARSNDQADRDKMARYVQAKNQSAAPDAPPPPQNPWVGMLRELVRNEGVTQAEWQVLQAQEQQAKQQGQVLYTPDYAGFQRLSEALRALRTKGTQPAKTDSSARVAAARRQAAAKKRLDLPKPDTGAPRNPTAPAADLPMSTSDLFRLGAKETIKKAQAQLANA